MSDPSSQAAPASSFSTRRVNASTFVIREDDEFEEHPLIYVKICSTPPAVIVCDTGCDAPSEACKSASITHLRPYLETFPLSINDGRPLNPSGQHPYIIICSHCHFDHTLGISQFSTSTTTQILASKAGKSFTETDLYNHGLFNLMNREAPEYTVTRWVADGEELWSAPESPDDRLPRITLLQVPGHTPDSLAWYDHEEAMLFVGDSLYEEGEEDRMPIVWPAVGGDLVIWAESMTKLRKFVQERNRALAEESEKGESGEVGCRPVVRLSAGHQTVGADAEEILERLRDLWERTLKGEIPVASRFNWGEEFCRWKEVYGNTRMSFQAPTRLMVEARRHFGVKVGQDD